MFGNKKTGLILAGLAAYAYYKYNKMSEEEKRNLVSGLKEKGQKIYEQYVPTEVKNMFGKKEAGQTAGQPSGDGSGEFAI